MNERPIEVEIKARISDPESIRSWLAKNARFLEEIDYHDVYFKPESIEGYTYNRFRLRMSGKNSLVTVKDKIANGGGEACAEVEFEVSDTAAFIAFIRSFGFAALVEKTKKGKRYIIEAGPSDKPDGPARIELIEIGGLGWFVEIEIMVANEDEIGGAWKRIKKIFRELGIGEEDVETRPYTRMIFDGPK